MARELKLSLPPADDIFSTQAERDDAKREKVIEIETTLIDGFPDHPFQVVLDEPMKAMIESVKTYGIQTPAIVRPEGNGRFELVSGHRRKMACELAGVWTMPCIVRNMDYDSAIIAMVDSNMQRETILPSEKAKSYKMKMEALNRQGLRTDLTFSPVGKKLYAHEQVAHDSGESKNQIFRYIRLTELIPQVLSMVDEGKIAMRPAVELSYLPPEQQSTLLEEMMCEDRTPSHVQAMKMRKYSEEGRLSEDVIHSILQEEKPNQVEQFKMPRDKISKFFEPGTPVQKIEETIVKALELYRQRERNRDAR
jgi:ParB family chromosome partitioning protein